MVDGGVLNKYLILLSKLKKQLSEQDLWGVNVVKHFCQVQYHSWAEWLSQLSYNWFNASLSLNNNLLNGDRGYRNSQGLDEDFKSAN